MPCRLSFRSTFSLCKTSRSLPTQTSPTHQTQSQHNRTIGGTTIQYCPFVNVMEFAPPNDSFPLLHWRRSGTVAAEKHAWGGWGERPLSPLCIAELIPMQVQRVQIRHRLNAFSLGPLHLDGTRAHPPAQANDQPHGLALYGVCLRARDCCSRLLQVNCTERAPPRGKVG